VAPLRRYAGGLFAIYMDPFNTILVHLTVMHIFGWCDSTDWRLVHDAGMSGEITIQQEELLESFIPYE